MSRRKRFSPIFGPLVTLEDRLTPAAMSEFAGPLPLGVAASEVIGTAGPRDDRDGVELFTRTEIMAGLTGDAPLATLAADRGLSHYLDIAGSRVILTQDGVHLAELKLQPGFDPRLAIAQVRQLPYAAWAEPNVISQYGPDLTPNDPSYTNSGQYFLSLSQANLAWDINAGQAEIVVAIADDGVGYNHPDLVDNIWINAAESDGAPGVDDDNNGYVDDIRGWDVNTNDNTPLPAGSNTHGTHVAGIVAARTNNGVGVAGTAGGDGTAGSGVRIMPVRWAGTNSWTSSRVAESLAYAADNGAKLFNSSYNFDGWAGNTTVNSGLNYAYGKDVLMFFSAGNGGALDPARRVFTQQLFVANLNSSDVRSSSSNYGDYVDVAGSGSSIYSTTTSSNGTGATYSTLSGTSMSSPHAAGVAALIWSQNPTWTRDQVAAHLLATTDDTNVQNVATLNLNGTGRVNAYRGLTETIPAPRFGRTVNIPLDGSAAIAPSSFTLYVPMRFDPASITGSNFELRRDGADNIFDTADDLIVPLVINAGAAYQMGTNTLVFTRSGGGTFTPDGYRLTARSGSTQLRDPFGTALDGDSDGVAGGDFVRTFDWLAANVNSLSGSAFVDWRGDGTRDSIDPVLTAEPVTVFLDDNNNAVRDTVENTFTVTANQSIPAAGRIFVPLDVSGLTAPANDVDVRVNITHPRLSDLDLFVIGPNGQRVALATDVGGSGDNFVNTRFSDEASTAITAGSAPFNGTFRPESSLTAFDGEIANGTWLLEVVDDNPAAQTGTFLVSNWSLIVSTAEATATTDASGQYTFTNLAAGTYTIRTLAAPAGWTATAPSLAYTRTIASGGTSTNSDFGFAKNGTLYGLAVNDINGNGTFDIGETSLAGRTVFVDSNANGVLDSSGSITLPSSNVPVAITDNTTVSSTLTVSGISGGILDLNVAVTLSHTYMGEVRVRLVGPGGQIVTLINNRGGSGNNLTGTVFDDEAATSISTSSPPFTGTFRPESPLSVFDGLSANGVWTLEVTDAGTNDTGSLASWSLTMSAGELSAITPANGTFSFDLPAGPNTLTLLPLPGWRPTNPADGKLVVSVDTLPLTDRNFLITTDTTAPQVASVVVNNGDPQRSRVTSIAVNFNERMSFPAGVAAAFALTGPLGAQPFAATVDDSGLATRVTLTFPNQSDWGSLRDGIYSLEFITANAEDLAQNSLAATAPVQVRRLFGDIDLNGTVAAADFAAFGSVFGLNVVDSPFDFDANGTINSADFAAFGARFGITL